MVRWQQLRTKATETLRSREKSMESQQTRRDFVKTSVFAGAPVALGGSIAAAIEAGESANPSDMSFFEVVRSRRSVREFQPTPIPEEHLRQILDAARMAPTSGNQQPWKFLVVRDRAVIDGLKESCVKAAMEAREARGMPVSSEVESSVAESLQGYFSAPVYIVVLTDGESRYPTYNHWDGPLAAGHLMLAARALGYGTVFITDSIPAAVTKEVLNIPDRYTRVCITPLGVPVEWPDAPPKKELDEFIVLDRF
jgi:nitroreductase